MPLPFRLGKMPHLPDNLVPRMAAFSSKLPPPPLNSNWYADVPEWRMLGNDMVGDCVEAFALHYIMQQSAYANPGHGLIASDDEALALYSAVTGYNPAYPSTDNGTVVLGRGGMMQYWASHGVVCGGVTTKASAYIAVDIRNTKEIMQAVHIFGGVGLGFRVPARIMEADSVPFVWDNPNGPYVGGHEVLICGYETVAGNLLFDFITWGQRCRMTLHFLQVAADEAVAVYDPISLNARGVNASGLDGPTLIADMRAIHTMGFH